MKLSIVFALFMLFVLSCCSSEQKAEQEKKPNIYTELHGGLSWKIGTFVIDGHKYIYFSTSNGVAICPTKEDF